MSGGDGRVRVLVTDWEFDDLGIEEEGLTAAGLELVHAQCRTPDEVIAAATETRARGLLVQYAPITGDVLRAVPDLGVVARYGVGVDNVDLAAAEEQGVWVCNVTGYGDEEVATHASSLVLGLLRGIPFHDRSVRSGGWDYKQARPVHRTSVRTLGVLGLGRIGRRTAELLGPFFGEVIGADPHLPDEHWPAGVERVGTDELLSRAQVLTLHLPLTEETHHLLDADALARLPEGAVVVNTSRGGLVDEEALVTALDDGPVGAAALDVLSQEPAPADHPLRSHPRVVLTPHAAWYSTESERILRSAAVQNVVAWAEDRRPAYPVVTPG